MAATQLVLHHRYRQNIAYDWSGKANHGYLVDVGTSDPSGGLAFTGNPASRVEVRNSSSLRDFGELRIRVIFEPRPGPVANRYNLVEGRLAFALVINADGSLEGTINSPSAGWQGPQSAPGAVSMDRWHTADFEHDGISRGRLYLDGALVAERIDVPGPIPDLASLGIVIGHWPDDDRYTLVGGLDEVQIWKDDPKRDAARAIDDCCLDRDWVDQRVREARRRGWTAEQAHDSLAKLFADARAATAEVRGGDPARIAQMNTLTEQALSCIAAGNTVGLEASIGSLEQLVLSALGPARLDQLGQELLGALRATPVGDWMGSTDEEALGFFQEIVARACLGGMVPDAPEGRGHGGNDQPLAALPPRDPSTDTVTDVPVPEDPTPADEQVDAPPGADPGGPTRPGPNGANR